MGALIAAIGMPAAAERLALRTYTTADGLPSSYVHRIVADSRGLLWFCTRDGLSRFDGSQFVTYSVQEGLPHSHVNHLLETRQGTYWVATNGGGVCRFEPKGGARKGEVRRGAAPSPALFTAFRVGNNHLSNRVNVLFEDRRERLWVGTDDGLFQASAESQSPAFQRVPLPRKLEGVITQLTEDDGGHLWVGSVGGLTRIAPDGHASMELEIEEGVAAVLCDREGRLWVGTHRGLLQIGAEGRRRWYTEGDGLAGNDVNGLYQSRDGRIWAGGAGLSEFDGKRFLAHSKDQGILSLRRRGISEDRDGNLWLVAAAGAMKLALDGFRTYDVNDGLAENRVQSVFADAQGRVMATGVDAGTLVTISRFDGTRFHAIQPKLPRDAEAVWPLQGAILDRGGEWWLLTNKGLLRFGAQSGDLARSRPRAVYDRLRGLTEEAVASLFEDRQGDLWMGPLLGRTTALTRWVRSLDRFRTYTEADGLPRLPAAASAFAEDGGGRLWIGFQSGGLARRDGDRFTLFGPAQGFEECSTLAMHADRAGRLWIATNQNGMIRVDGAAAGVPHFVKYTVREGLASNNVRCLTEDRWGRIYAGTVRGVDRLDPETGHVQHYSSNDGLPNDSVNGAFCDGEGTLWFGTMGGLARLTPKRTERAAAPPIWIEGVRAAGVSYPLSAIGEKKFQGLVLGANGNHIQIDFFSLSFGTGESLRYQFMLEGADAVWGPPGRQRTVHYASLSPGSYRFLVRAVNADGAHSEYPAEVVFEILAPFWKRGWFLAVAGMAGASMLYGLHHIRVTRLIQMERLRRRIAADLHDDIGASLSRMAILSELTKREVAPEQKEAGQRLAQIADTARGLVDAMSDIVWSVDPRRDDLDNVALRVRQLAVDLLGDRRIDWALEAPEHLDKVKLNPEQRRHLYLIFKEALTNIVRHSGSRSVRLTIRVEGSRIEAEIRDDGQGFDPACAKGHGLENMRARAAQVGGRIAVKSAAGEGTQIRIALPLRQLGA